MCEIAILNPKQNSASEIKSVAMMLYQRMSSSLGVVVVNDADDTETFEYEIYEDTDPDPDDVFSFIDEEVVEATTRIIIHGRLATQGEVTKKNAHPIEIECEECDVDYVLHNGMVRQFEFLKKKHEGLGHEYHTNVDSESIAHAFGEVPDEFSVDVMEEFAHEPAFILMNEERIFIRSGTYHLTEDGRMSRHRRDFGPNSREEDYGAVIITPREEEE